MRYCKNCGRQLEDGARFCERCGKSVRQSRESENSKKQKQIEKLQRERLERKRRQEQREAIEKKRKENLHKQRIKHSKTFICVFALIAAVIIIAVISYSITSKSSENADWINTPTETANTTLTPTMQPSITDAPVNPVTPGENDAIKTNANKDDYKIYELANGMEIPYPEVFDKDETSGNEKLNLTDDFGGGANMIVCYGEYPGGTTSSLMKEFASDTRGDIVESRAVSNCYSITIDDDGEITHRKYIIDSDNDVFAYYDFIYNDDSDYAEDYEAYIEYIDLMFDY